MTLDKEVERHDWAGLPVKTEWPKQMESDSTTKNQNQAFEKAMSILERWRLALIE